MDAALLGQRLPTFPACRLGEGLARAHCLLLALGDDAEETAVAHEGHDPGQLAHGVLVEGGERCAIARRTHDAAGSMPERRMSCT